MCHGSALPGPQQRLLLLALAAAALPVGALALSFNPLAPENHGLGLSSFVADNGLLCAEGPPRLVEGALAMRKASARGSLYRGSAAALGRGCESRSFRQGPVPDDCHPGLKLYFKTQGARAQAVEGSGASTAPERGAVEDYMARYNLTRDTAYMMDSCMCHPSSPIGRTMHGKCATLQMPGSWVHRDPKDPRDALLCAEAPFIQAFRSLVAMKSTKMLPMHMSDQVSPRPCVARGFPVEDASPFHCFKRHRMWTSAATSADTGIQHEVEVERGLYYRGDFRKYAAPAGVHGSVFGSIPGCHCSPSSAARAQFALLCLQPGASPPIRDWWLD